MACPTLSPGTPAAVDVQVRDRRGRPLTQRPAWVRSLAAPIREFIATENAGAVVLLMATVAALLWADSPWRSAYRGTDASGPNVFLGEIFTGGQRAYRIPALPPGRYFYRCDVHPTAMTGTLLVR